MRSPAIFFFVILGFLESSISLPNQGQFGTTSITQSSYYGSIEINGKYACGATIIDDYYVMTTYSCVEGINVTHLAVRVGTDRQGRRGQFFKVVDVSSWTGNPFIGPSPEISYDVAMVKVAVPFAYNPHVMWANPNADGVNELQEGTLVGWANPKVKGSRLVSANAFLLPSSNCSQIYAGVMNISDDMYCLWPSDTSRQLSFADMGDPWYCNEQYSGIVTHVPVDPTYPVVITGIAKFTSFIIMVLCNMKNIFANSLDSMAASHGVQEMIAARQSLMVN